MICLVDTSYWDNPSRQFLEITGDLGKLRWGITKRQRLLIFILVFQSHNPVLRGDSFVE